MKRIALIFSTVLMIVVCTSSIANADTKAEIRGLSEWQVLVGQWRGSSQVKGIKRTGGVENVNWRWDFARGQRPTLLMELEDGIFFQGGKLSFDTEKKEYRLIAKRYASTTDREKLDTLILRGKSELDPEDITMNVLTLNGKIKGGYLIRVSFHNREKHHYICKIQLKKPDGEAFIPVRTFSVTREGESIAKIEEAVKGPICIISGGLGTSSRTYKGETYYFCCSGCSKTFDDDPDTWIAQAEKDKVKAAAEAANKE